MKLTENRNKFSLFDRFDQIIKKYKYKPERDWWIFILEPKNRAEWMQNAINPETRIKHQPPMINKFIQELGLERLPKVLDVGSGPLSPLAWCVDQKLIEVTAVDPLAEIYAEILESYSINYPIKPIYGTGEVLSEMFEKGQFDIVYTRNAIDHADSPPQCVINMIDVLKNGGFLYMEGFQNEGQRNHYQGLHRWNLSLDENCNLLCGYKKRQKINITKELPVKCLYTYPPDANDWYAVVYKRDLV